MTKSSGRFRVMSLTKTRNRAARASSRPLVLTGVRCEACRRPVGVLDHIAEYSLTLLCPACGHRWTAATHGLQQH
jgi:hypothetical protein